VLLESLAILKKRYNLRYANPRNLGTGPKKAQILKAF